MSHVVGMLLLHCTAPSDTFKVFSNLVMQETLYSFYTVDLMFIKRYFKVFWRLLKETCPRMYEGLTKPGQFVSCNKFLFSWITTLFSQTLQI